jgi:hypothetical protein
VDNNEAMMKICRSGKNVKSNPVREQGLPKHLFSKLHNMKAYERKQPKTMQVLNLGRSALGRHRRTPQNRNRVKSMVFEFGQDWRIGGLGACYSISMILNAVSRKGSADCPVSGWFLVGF